LRELHFRSERWRVSGRRDPAVSRRERSFCCGESRRQATLRADGSRGAGVWVSTKGFETRVLAKDSHLMGAGQRNICSGRLEGEHAAAMLRQQRTGRGKYACFCCGKEHRMKWPDEDGRTWPHTEEGVPLVPDHYHVRDSTVGPMRSFVCCSCNTKKSARGLDSIPARSRRRLSAHRRRV
jgi:hypothetical protein